MTGEAWFPRSWARSQQCPSCDPPTDWVRMLGSVGRLLWLECRVCGHSWVHETPLSPAAALEPGTFVYDGSAPLNRWTLPGWVAARLPARRRRRGVR